MDLKRGSRLEMQDMIPYLPGGTEENHEIRSIGIAGHRAEAGT
jgi:hypothetical protein